MKTRILAMLARALWPILKPMLEREWKEQYEKAITARDADKRDAVVELRRAP